MYDRLGADNLVHLHSGCECADPDYSSQARTESGYHHRGGGHEQPQQEAGIQCGTRIYQADQQHFDQAMGQGELKF